MPHEAPLFLLRERPELAAELLRDALGIPVPPHTRAQVEDADFTQIVPSPYHADLVITLRDDGPVMGIVVEIQLSPKPDKRFVWPLYLAALHAKLRCQTCLVILVPTDDLARWAEEPIGTLQPGSTLVPIALGPSRIPVVTSDEQAARSPEAAVLSALAHGKGEHRLEVARAALGAAARLIDDPRRTFYIDLVLKALGAEGRALLELNMDLTNYEFQSEFFISKLADAKAKAEAEGRALGEAQGRALGEAQGRALGEAQGVAQGEARAIVRFLEARGIAVSAEIRAQILSCTDVGVLERWLDRAVNAPSAEAVVAD